MFWKLNDDIDRRRGFGASGCLEDALIARNCVMEFISLSAAGH
jgi:hypothetical protein